MCIRFDIFVVIVEYHYLSGLVMEMNQIKQSAGQILSDVKKQIKLDSIMVCDSALLSLENIQLISNLKWITRVPMTLKKTKEIIGSYLEKVKVSPETDPNIQEITREFQKKGYKWLEQKVTYAGIKQRWLIVESAERKQSDLQKLNSKIEQEKNPALKLRKKLETTGFDTVTQAQNYLKSINKKLKLWEEQIFRNQVKKN